MQCHCAAYWLRAKLGGTLYIKSIALKLTCRERVRGMERCIYIYRVYTVYVCKSRAILGACHRRAYCGWVLMCRVANCRGRVGLFGVSHSDKRYGWRAAYLELGQMCRTRTVRTVSLGKGRVMQEATGCWFWLRLLMALYTVNDERICVHIQQSAAMTIHIVTTSTSVL